MGRAILSTCIVVMAACADTNSDTAVEQADTMGATVDQGTPGTGLRTDPAAAAGLTGVDVTLGDGTVTLASDSVAAGVVSLRIHNGGSVAHRFRLEGNGEEMETEDLQPGTDVTMTMNLTTGTYQLSCTRDGHDQQGEQAALRVQ